MRIVLLSQWYEPEPEPRVYRLAKELAARGHSVTVITGLPNYPEGRIYPGYKWSWRPKVESKEGVRVVRLPLYADHSRSAIRRILNYLSFATSAAVFGPIMSGPVDVLWVYHPPLTVMLGALTVGLFRRAPVVLEIQDLWPETLAATGMIRSKSLLKIVGKAALAVYRLVARITVISPGFKENLVSKGVDAGKVTVIPNWADEAVYRPHPPDEELRRELGLTDKFTVLYAGNIGAAQDLGNLLDAAALLKGHGDVGFVVAGEGVERDRLEARARAEGLANVTFLGRVSAARVAQLTALSSAVLVHLKKDPLFEVTIPSKTISALACGKPIITVSEGDPADVVRAAGAGIACAPGSPDELAHAILELQSMDPARRSAMGADGRRYFLENLTAGTLVPRIVDVMRSASDKT